MIKNIEYLIGLFIEVDNFCKEFRRVMSQSKSFPASGSKHRNRPSKLSYSEIITLILYFQISNYKDFKHFYMQEVLGHLHSYFPKAVSYNRFVELESRVGYILSCFLFTHLGKCTGISYVDSTSIPVCHIIRYKRNKLFQGMAKKTKGTMGWYYGLKLHLICNEQGEIINFLLTPANVDDRDDRVWTYLSQNLYGKVYADRGYISAELSESLFEKGIQLITGIKKNMKNKLLTIKDKILLRKRLIIETINGILKNKEQLVHTRHRSINNFLIHILGTITAYCLDNSKPTILNCFLLEQ